MTNCKVFWPAPVCSGNGVCNESIGKCICNVGWSSIGDYALEEGVDCNIHLQAVTALWSIDLIFYCITFIVLIRLYYIRYITSKAAFQLSEPSFQSPFFFTISVVAHIILASLRISSPERRVIGEDPAATTILIFGSTFATWTGLSFFQSNVKFLQSIVKTIPERSREIVSRRINVFKNGLPFAYALALIAAIMPMFGLRYPQYIFWFSFAYHFIIAVPVHGFILFGMNNILQPTISEIENHINSCKANNSAQDVGALIVILNKLKMVEKQTNSTILVSMIFLLIGCWPYVNRNGSYATAILSMFGTLSILHVSMLLNPTKVDNSSNDEKNKSRDNRKISTRVKDVNENYPGVPTHPSSEVNKDLNSSIHPST